MSEAFSSPPSRRPEPFGCSGLAPLFRAESGDALLAMALANGGDQRIALGSDGRNFYGAPIRPAPKETWFSSATAAAISLRGWEAAGAALPRAFSAAGAGDWFDGLRARLLAAFALPGADCVFCASATEAEYAALVFARNSDGAQPKVFRNLLVGAGEIPRGAPLAASGRHFLASAPFSPALPGRFLAGWSEKSVALETLPLRDGSGAPLAAEAVDASAETLARKAAARGECVLLHVQDCSRSGLSGVSRDLAQRLMEELPEALTVVVDASQLRCPAAQIRADLEAGFMVLISGSKFAGGPAFCAALLAPPDMMWRLSRSRSLFWPEGLSAHSALLDWPPSLREKLSGPFGARGNQGLGLRWEAALAELELYLSLDPAVVERAIDLFAARTREKVARNPRLRCEAASARTILPISSRHCSGALRQAAPVLRALRGAGLHVGEPTATEALTVSLAAPQISDFVLALESGTDEIDAFAPLARDLERLFDFWGELLAWS